MKVTILGARGSIPTDGSEMLQFGGATSCVMAETDESVLFLDAGTGIINAPDAGGRSVSVLITHPHADHLIGLPFFQGLLNRNITIDFYAAVRDGLSAHDQIGRYISKPLWPCTIDDYPAKVRCHDLSSRECRCDTPIDIGGIKVTALESNHPGGGSIFRLEHDGGSFVYATDYEHSPEKDKELIDFARGTDLLLYDGQYTEEEYENKRGYGHSTPDHGVHIMHECEAKSMRIVHHDPLHNDKKLTEMEAAIKNDRTAFARQGEVICLQR